MGYRGRLIWPFLAEIEPIQTGDTEALGNYDHDFREPTKDNSGEDTTAFGQAYRLPVQFQTESTPYELQAQKPTGDNPQTVLHTLFHYQNLEDHGLLDSNGRPTIRLNDRLVAIYTMDGDLVRDFLDGTVGLRGLFCAQVQDRSFGLSGGKRNLLRVRWEYDRVVVSGL